MSQFLKGKDFKRNTTLDLCQTLCGKVKIMTFKILLKIPKGMLNKATHLGKEGCRTNIVTTSKWVSTIDIPTKLRMTLRDSVSIKTSSMRNILEL